MVICEVSNEHKALLCLISSLCSQGVPGAGSWWAQHCWAFPSACPLKSRIRILTTSHPFIVSLHFWGTPESARMLHTCKTTSLQPSPSSKLLPCPGQPLFYNTRDKNREESPSHLAWAWLGTAGTGAASTVEKDQRRQGEKSQVFYTALWEHLTDLTCWVVKEMFSVPSIFIFLLKELLIAGGGKENQLS